MQNISDIIRHILADEEIVVLEVREDSRNQSLKVVIDSQQPVTLGLTTRISRLLKDAPELEPVYPDGFQLQVTSPGVDTPLQYPFQFQKNLSRRLKLVIRQGETTRHLQAQLLAADEQGITLKSSSGPPEVISYENIGRAQVIVSFKGNGGNS